MKVIEVESLHADGGGRNFDFLKITTDDGYVGWSEYNEDFGGKGVSAVIDALSAHVIGQDPLGSEAIRQRMFAARRPAPGGLVAQALGAIENALLDIRGKYLNQPVYALNGGPLRDRIKLYWSHCGMYRARWPREMQLPPVRDLNDVRDMAAEVAAAGYEGLKANVLLFGDDRTLVHAPGFGGPGRFPELTADRAVIDTLCAQLEALRAGAGPDVAIALDLNFNFKADGYLKVARAVEGYGLAWLELDGLDPAALRHLRNSVAIPIASLETLFGRKEFLPYLEQRAVDTVIVDVAMNGFAESVRIANLADSFDLNVAPHNFYGPLANLIAAHFRAAVPNIEVMEIDGDRAPWYDEFVNRAAVVRAGRFELPTAPGWGADVDEDAVRRHPAR